MSEQFTTSRYNPAKRKHKTEKVLYLNRSHVLQSVSDAEQNINLTQFWKDVQSSWKTNEPGLSSILHFFLIDCNVVEKSDTYLEK